MSSELRAHGCYDIQDWETVKSVKIPLNIGDRSLSLEFQPPNWQDRPSVTKLATFTLTGVISNLFCIFLDFEVQKERGNCQEFIVRREVVPEPTDVTLTLTGSFRWLSIHGKSMRIKWEITEDTNIPSPPQTRGGKYLYCGLENGCALCYLNVGLQIIFHIPWLRKMIVEAAEKDASEREKSVFLSELADLFRHMSSQQRCNTRNLTKCFGWPKGFLNQSQDAYEFLSVILDRLDTIFIERKCNGIKNLYRGEFEITNKEDGSVRKEEFGEISLCVSRGFRLAVEEVMRNEKSTITISRAPPLLIFQANVRGPGFGGDGIPEFLNMKRWSSCDGETRYELYACIVYLSAHYYVLLRPTIYHDWVRFNDGSVLSVSVENVLRPIPPPKNQAAQSPSFILVYIREDQVLPLMAESKLTVCLEEVKPEGSSDELVVGILTPRDLAGISLNNLTHLKRQCATRHVVKRSASVLSVVDAVSDGINGGQCVLWRRNGNGPLPNRMLGRSSTETFGNLAKRDLLVFVDEKSTGESNQCILFLYLFVPETDKRPFLGQITCPGNRPVRALEPEIRKLIGDEMLTDADTLLYFVGERKAMRKIDVDKAVDDYWTGWPIIVQIVNEQVKLCDYSIPPGSTDYVPYPGREDRYAADFAFQMGKYSRRFALRGFGDEKKFKMMMPASIKPAEMKRNLIRALELKCLADEIVLFLVLMDGCPAARPFQFDEQISSFFKSKEKEWSVYYHVCPARMSSCRVTIWSASAVVPDRIEQVATARGASVRTICESVGIVDLDKYKLYRVSGGRFIKDITDVNETVCAWDDIHIEPVREDPVRIQVVYAVKHSVDCIQRFGEPFWVGVTEDNEEELKEFLTEKLTWIRDRHELVIADGLVTKTEAPENIYRAACERKVLCVLVYPADKSSFVLESLASGRPHIFS